MGGELESLSFENLGGQQQRYGGFLYLVVLKFLVGMGLLSYFIRLEFLRREQSFYGILNLEVLDIVLFLKDIK